LQEQAKLTCEHSSQRIEKELLEKANRLNWPTVDACAQFWTRDWKIASGLQDYGAADCIFPK